VGFNQYLKTLQCGLYIIPLRSSHVKNHSESMFYILRAKRETDVGISLTKILEVREKGWSKK